jgi:hypothetical protein
VISRTARAALVAAVLCAAPARAVDLFSPGELARAHASLEGLSSCTKCHPQGQQLSQDTCLECHRELKGRVAQGRGFHGRLQGKDRDCWTCHHDHQGRSYAMVDWGPGGKKGFDHARTGFALKGKHQGLDCEKCHEPRLIADPAVRELLDKQPQRKTFLGAQTTCAGCHADEHRGQSGPECQKCHVESGWKPAPLFDHARTAYLLRGKHEKVACDKCHPKVEDPVEHVGLQPRHKTFLRLKPVHHETCLDCHKDPHQGRFGESCTKCHTESDWRTIVSGATEVRGFHDKTRYRLEGAHANVQCKPCHGPFPGEKAVFKGLAFAACTDCHVDAHAGQMKKASGQTCDRCHGLSTFETSRFGAEEHQQTRYPLEGAHRTVACASCHQSDPRVGERFPAAAREELLRRGRQPRLSLGTYQLAGNLSRCETCHADPHGGQFDKKAGEKGCQACHELSAFSKTRFDHAKDTKFPLEGKHQKAACAACHPSARGARGQAQVKYTGVETTCAGCHADPHGSQFAKGPREPSDCARCHGADDWKKPLRFVHELPFTDFKLTGKHQKAECKACHPEVRLSGEARARRYKGVPRACEGCHADFHKGQFRGFEP